MAAHLAELGFASYAEWMWSEREGLGTALSALFDAWLFTPTKPDAPGASAGAVERLVAPGAGQGTWMPKGQMHKLSVP